MKRIEHDYYPTPPDAVEALRIALCDIGGTIEDYEWLDPAAGAGTLLEWLGVPRQQRHAIELRADAEPHLLERVDRARLHVGVDALAVPWPEGPNLVANPPFNLLDAFVRRIVAELDASEKPRVAAVLMPTQWLQAQSRADIRPPKFLWALRWRANFRAEGGGAAHDVAWAVWGTSEWLHTSMKWLPRPAVPGERFDKFRAILGLPVTGRLDLFAEDSHASP